MHRFYRHLGGQCEPIKPTALRWSCTAVWVTLRHMRAAVLTSFERPPKMQDVPEPSLGPDDVLVHVRAAAAHPLVRAIAAGKHYASPKQLPAVLGVDGVGTTDAGERVYFGPLRPPLRAMAERVAVPRALCTPLPPDIDQTLVASLINPGLAALLPLSWRAQLQPQESVCILGATGAAGNLAVRLARAMGAGRIVAVGRQQAMLDSLREHGATDTLTLAPNVDLEAAFREKAGPEGFDVVLDYLFGPPAQAMLDSIAKNKYAKEIRFVQVGEMAGPSVNVTGAVLRSTGLMLSGFGLRATGMAPRKIEIDAIARLLQFAKQGIVHVEGRAVAVEELESAWSQPGPRLVITF